MVVHVYGDVTDHCLSEHTGAYRSMTAAKQEAMPPLDSARIVVYVLRSPRYAGSPPDINMINNVVRQGMANQKIIAKPIRYAP